MDREKEHPTSHHGLRNRDNIKYKRKIRQQEIEKESPPPTQRRPKNISPDVAKTLVKFINQANGKLTYYQEQHPLEAHQRSILGPRQSNSPDSNPLRQPSKEKSRNKKQKGSPMKQERTNEQEEALIALLAEWLTPSPSSQIELESPSHEPHSTLPSRPNSLFPAIAEACVEEENRSSPPTPMRMAEPSISSVRQMQEMEEQKPSAIEEGGRVGDSSKTFRNKSTEERKPHKRKIAAHTTQTNPVIWQNVELRRNGAHIQVAISLASEEEKEKKNHDLPVGFRLQ